MSNDPIQMAIDALEYAERQICYHEETHRGGAIWTICDQCGAKFADDRGGLEKVVSPYEEALTALRQHQQGGGWRNMDEAPRDGTGIWAYKLRYSGSPPDSPSNEYICREIEYMANGEWYSHLDGYYEDTGVFLGWQPLPAAPKKESDDND